MSTFNPLETSSFLTNYDIQERIGTGSFGLVYKAKQKDRNQLLVIKQIPFSTKDNSTELQEARNEANILSKLNNRYVVKYYNSFEEGGYLYIIMEYCEGGDLSSYLSKMQKLVSHLTEIQIWKFFIQMSLGLAYIHYKKILHRDLKSLNIFLTKNLDVKIGDLGVAKILQNTIHAYTFIGTPYYLSPEILEEKPYNEKSDVWALGCILYEMATFKHPYSASNQAALFLKIKNGKYEPLGNHYTHELKKMVQTLLDKNSFSRPSMKQILEMQIFLDKAKYLGLYDATIEMLSKLNINNSQNTNADNNSNNNNSHSNNKNYSGKKLLKSRQIKLIQIESNKKLNGKNISQVIKNDYNNYKNEMFEKHKQKRKTSEDLNSKQNNNNNNNNNHKRVRKAPSPSLIELPSNNNVKKIKNTNIRIKSHLHNINNKNAKPRVNESYDNARQSRGIISKIKLEPNKNFHSFLKNNNPIIKNNDKESKHSSNSHNRVSSARNNNSEDHLKHYILHKKANSKSKPTLEFVIINENTKEYEKTNKNENINNDNDNNNKQYNKDIHISIQSNFNEPPSNIKVKKFINYLNKQNNIKQQNRNFYNSNPINYKKSVSTSTKNIRSSYNSNCNNSNSNIKNRVCSSSSKEKSQLTHLHINNYSNDNCSSEMKRFINELNQKIPTLEDNNKNINNKRKKIKFKQPKQQQYPSQTETCLPSETFYVEEAGNHKMFPFKKEEYSNDEHELFNYSGSEDENNINNKSLGELENDLETDCNNNNNNEKCYSFTDESKSQKQEDENSSEGDEEKVSIVKNTNRFVHKEQEFINQLQKEYNDLKGKLMSFSHVINFNELLEIYSQIGNKNTQIEKTKNDIEQYIYEHIKEPEMAKTYSKLFEKWISAEIKLKNCFDN